MAEPSGRTGRPLRVLVGSPAAGLLHSARDPDPPAGTMVIDLGEDHPSRAGLIELSLWTSDGVITSAQVEVGFLHRGAEKLYEVRDYRQIIMLADRHDWQAPFAGELGIALLCEQQLGLEVPERATWLRTLLAEHTRMSSHLGFLGYLSQRLDRTESAGATDLMIKELRERLRHQLARLSGNRVHPMINRIGGLELDADHAWLGAETALAEQVARTAEHVLALIESSALSAALGDRLAPVETATVHQYGISGPIARASGVAADLRRDHPYLAYDQLADVISADREVPGILGTASRRFAVLAAELEQSSALIKACAERLGALSGPVSTKLGKIIRLPEGEGYLCTEAPLGRSGFYLVSRGERTPWRLKLRTPSFNNVAAWEAILPGVPVSGLESALASLGYVVGDIDK